MAEKDELESMRCRESMIQVIEHDGKRLWADGTVARWIHDADPGVQRISAEVNGPSFSLLVKAADHDDVDCVDLMRFGASLMGGCHFLGMASQCPNRNTSRPRTCGKYTSLYLINST